MSSEIAIKVENLSKCYQVFTRSHERLLQMLVRDKKQYFSEFWALKDVSFAVERGETVGIIGRNGSGKSTLLQLICGTLHPTSGTVQTNGRITALLELGAGFNPEFTGKENVYFNGAVFGMSRQEIDERYDAIAAFADIGQFIDEPVKTYSSGMLVRLAFALSIMAEPDIFIVDEALAVGDMNFKAKCMTAIKRLQDRGASILFVSHDMTSIKSLCARAVWLERNAPVRVGQVANIVNQFVKLMRTEENWQGVVLPSEALGKNIATKDGKIKDRQISSQVSAEEMLVFEQRVAQFRYGTGEVKVANAELLDSTGRPTTAVDFNEEVKINIYLRAQCSRLVSVVIQILDDKKNDITGASFRTTDTPYLQTEDGGNYLVECRINLPLLEGEYSIFVQVASPATQSPTTYYDAINDAVVFRINNVGEVKTRSKVYLFPEIKVVNLD
ncbi:MAG TPA: ABC transporter ATP-binding protein [Spongiibacteraceae bacterium]|nr:ABC transporter ATP-binding protein [Spongiibacteraceae bacterium]